MTSVTRVGAPRSLVPGRPSRVGIASFGVGEARTAPPAGADVAAAAPAGLLPALLAVQEALSEGKRNRTAISYGRAVLDELARLQVSLLSPPRSDARPIDRATLTRLAGLAETVPAVDDPALADALAAVSLRARIELARRHVTGEDG